MKKLVIGAFAALAMLSTACNKTEKNDAQFFSQQATDSLLIALGNAAGASYNATLANVIATDSTFSKDDFIKGIQYVMASDTSKSFSFGLQAGMQLQNMLANYRQMGLNPNTTVLMNTLRAAILSDSVPSQFEMQQIDATFRMWVDSLNNAKEAYEIAQLEASDEAKANIEAGKKYIADLQAKNPAVKIANSGLAYEIIEQGDGEKVDPEKKVCLTYTAKTTDGRVFDGRENQIIYLTNRPDGFREGVSMFNVGGKGVLYIPGNLAFGVKDSHERNRYGLGLNEMVIYEIEVLEVPAAPTAQTLPQANVPGRPRR